MNGYFFLTTRTNGEYLSLWATNFKLAHFDPRQRRRYLVHWSRHTTVFTEYMAFVIFSPHKKPPLYPVEQGEYGPGAAPFTQSLRKGLNRMVVSELRQPEFLWADIFSFNPSMVYPLDALFSAPLDMAMITHKTHYDTTWSRLPDGTILLDYEEYTADWEGYL